MHADMVRFADVEGLSQILITWNPSYGLFAQAIWDKGITDTNEIANAPLDALLPLVKDNIFIASNMQAMAKDRGTMNGTCISLDSFCWVLSLPS